MVLLVRRQWCAWCAGALLALLLSRWPPVATVLPLVGVLCVGHAMATLAARWLALSLPRSLVATHRRAVLVTGCDSGFGHAAALRLAALGARVYAGVLQPEGSGAQVLRRSATSQRLRVLPLDVTDDASVTAAVDHVTRELAESEFELWAVINNAGILKLGECEWMNIDDVKQSLEVNVLGQIRITRAFLPLLRKSKGRVVNVISLASRVVLTALAPYTISKFASLAFTETLRCDLSKFSISVHNIEPWIYRTNLTQLTLPMLQQKMEEIPEAIKNYYSDNYKQKICKLTELVFTLTAVEESNIYQVVDAIEDACFAEDPMMRYLPGYHSKIIETLTTYISYFQPLVLKLIFRSKMK